MQNPATPAPTPLNRDLAGGSGTAVPFDGFDPPESNFWRLPNNWFDIVAAFTSWAEHKVVEYILRHTWGYHEYDVCKQITMDEFMHGRKRRDGSRIDAGCGMAENSIKKGIADAVAHGFLVVEVDDSDRGRIKKYYGPRMRRPSQDEGEHALRPLPAPTPGGVRISTPHAHSGPAQHAASPAPASGSRATGRRTQIRRGEGQSLPGQGQRLTPQDQRLRAEGPKLTPDHQRATLAPQALIPNAATIDPATGKESSQEDEQEERHDTTDAVALFPVLPSADDPAVEVASGPVSALGGALPGFGHPETTSHAAPRHRPTSPAREASGGRSPLHAGATQRFARRVSSRPQPAPRQEDAIQAAPRDRSAQADLIGLLVDEGIAHAKARMLVQSYPAERIRRQLNWIDGRSYQNRTATLIAAIERDYTAPAPRRAAPTTGETFDRAKFYRGAYAVCAQCGSRPCLCAAPQAAQPTLK